MGAVPPVQRWPKAQRGTGRTLRTRASNCLDVSARPTELSSGLMFTLSTDGGLAFRNRKCIARLGQGVFLRRLFLNGQTRLTHPA